MLFFPLLLTAQTDRFVDFSLKELDENPGKVQVADIDRDGINDVIKLGGSKGQSLVLYKFSCNGEFKKHILIEKENFRSDRLVLKDIDKDGDLDLTTGIGIMDGAGKEISLDVVWLENPLPTGNATRAKSWKVHKAGNQEGYIKDINIVDFDRDGMQDIITRANTQTVIYFQTKTGQWQNDVVLDHESHEGMDIGDLDKDGDVDIVLNGFWFETPSDVREGKFIKHVYDTKWFTPVDNSWRDNNAAIKVADMNQDGIPDILISHSELTGYPISLYMASSIEALKTGRWNELQIDEQFDYCQTLDAADVDNDGDLDVLAAKFPRSPDEGIQWLNKAPYPVAVYYNVGGSARVWKKQVINNDGMYAGVFGDVGSDGVMDIVGPRSYFEGPVKLFKHAPRKLSLDKWTYIRVDSTRDNYVIPGAQPWWNYFGLDMYDVNRDGLIDIVAGEWYYRNPGGDMSNPLERITFPVEVDAVLALDVDDDEFADVIGLRLPQVYWLEANDREGKTWSYTEIGTMRQTGHANAQEYALAQIIPGGKREIILGDEIDQYFFEIPANPENTPWPRVTITGEGMGYRTGDIDQDGFLDLVGGYALEGVGGVLEGTFDVKKDNRMIAWWKNPGNGKGNWLRFDIGKGTSPERYVVADFNGDGKLDVATSDERYPGNVRNAYLTLYQQTGYPVKNDWEKFIITTSKSMNSMDGADIDNDGDIDLVVGEHEMQGGAGKPLLKDERVIIYENNGSGKFTPHIVDQGKESHLGTQLADLDSDGDIDLVSIAWREPAFLHLWRNDAIKNGVRLEKDSTSINRKYKVNLTIHSNGYERVEKPVEVPLDFTSILGKAGIKSSFSINSLQLTEINAAGEILDLHIPFQFDTAAGFNALNKALGTLVFILKGNTAPNQSRHFQLYFDDLDHKPDSFGRLINIEDIGEYEGYPTYKINTPGAEYFYHNTSGGFASLIDKEGNDWISYHPNKEPEEGFKGRYRGIPNIAPPEFHPGTPEGKKKSIILSEGPLKISLLSETADEQWKIKWDIYPEYATMTLLEKGKEPYWILYEGTPGGTFNVEDYWVHSDGRREIMRPYTLKEQWTGRLPSPKWVYFGDSKLDRVLFFIRHEDYEHEDVFWHSGEGGMTVFGFGRGPTREKWQQLTKAPAHLTIGFAEKNDFASVSRLINSVYRSIKVSVGDIMKVE